MRWGGRIAAAIEILGEVFDRHRPASEALRDWGRAHRFAGSGDRHAIGTLVYDVLRKRNSLSLAMGETSPRALVLAALHHTWGKSIATIAEWAGEPYGPGPLRETERNALGRPPTTDVPIHIEGDFPEWLDPALDRAFGP